MNSFYSIFEMRVFLGLSSASRTQIFSLIYVKLKLFAIMFQSATHKWLLQRVDYKHNFLLVYDFPKFSITRSQSFKSIKSMQQFIRRYKLVPDSNCIRFEVINNVFTPFTVIGTEKVYITKVLKLQAWSHEVNKAFASGEFRMLRLTD